jgi:hypothetical protein
MALADEIRAVLSDTAKLPPEFLSYIIQHGAQHPVHVQSLNAPTVIASGVGSTANAPTRYVGGTASGAPASGTYVAGDFVVSHDGHIYICTAGGAPGTWSTWPAQGEIRYDSISAAVNVTGTSSVSPTTIVPGTSVTYTGSDVYIEAFCSLVATPSVAGSNVAVIIQKDGVTISRPCFFVTPAAAQMACPLFIQWKDTPSAGNHTYSLAAYTNTTTGTPVVGQLGSNSTFLRVRYA